MTKIRALYLGRNKFVVVLKRGALEECQIFKVPFIKNKKHYERAVEKVEKAFEKGHLQADFKAIWNHLANEASNVGIYFPE